MKMFMTKPKKANIERAKAMREANGIFGKSGLVEYKFFEEEEKE